VSSARKLFNSGIYYHFSLVLLILTALKIAHESVQRVLDPTANNRVGYLPSKAWLPAFGWLQVLQETPGGFNAPHFAFLNNSGQFSRSLSNCFCGKNLSGDIFPSEIIPIKWSKRGFSPEKGVKIIEPSSSCIFALFV
jgi:hypothetical protein